MMFVLIAMGTIGWFGSGVAGFVFWWTKDHNFTNAEVFLAILVGCSGPLAWLIGYTIHGKGLRTIIRRRRG